ncbi:MAG: hypothetical protein D6724_09390 [Armatimonadetes bacterium]|nr:MAG: hypothetical protein D6724_09390 [Armatimonadota bacterium]
MANPALSPKTDLQPQSQVHLHLVEAVVEITDEEIAFERAIQEIHDAAEFKSEAGFVICLFASAASMVVMWIGVPLYASWAWAQVLLPRLLG